MSLNVLKYLWNVFCLFVCLFVFNESVDGSEYCFVSSTFVTKNCVLLIICFLFHQGPNGFPGEVGETGEPGVPVSCSVLSYLDAD